MSSIVKVYEVLSLLLSPLFFFFFFFFGFEGEVWDLIVSIPDHCLSLNFKILMKNR